jgi:hypothetical protein
MEQLDKKRRALPDTKRILLFFARFIAVSLVLYTAWIFIGKYYTVILAWGAYPLTAMAGNGIDVARAKLLTEEISLNPVVYLSLLIAVKGVPWKKRLKPAIIGLLVLTAANIIIVFLVFLSEASGSESLWAGTEFLYLTINFFLSVLLWFLLSEKGDLFEFNS